MPSKPKKQQVIVIGGGETFDTYKEYLSSLKKYKVHPERLTKKGWKDNLQKTLGGTYEVLKLEMPCKLNAKYIEWKIWFEKYIPFFNREIILVGHSMGGIFIAKYLSENKYPKKVRGTFMVAPPFNDHTSRYSLADFTLPKKLTGLEKQGGVITLYQSKDDAVVPHASALMYKNSLPSISVKMFGKKGHFNQATFPEILRDVKALK